MEIDTGFVCRGGVGVEQEKSENGDLVVSRKKEETQTHTLEQLN